MSDNWESFHGIVDGQTIKLDRLPKLADGSKVDVVVRKSKLLTTEQEAKLQLLFGGCAEDAADLDNYLQWNREQRSNNGRSDLRN